MRRRLDVAASLVAQPAVVFLDEPTTGLDPHGRIALWQLLGEFAGQGASVLRQEATRDRWRRRWQDSEPAPRSSMPGLAG